MGEKGMNKCQFIGRLGADPETRYSPSGDAITTFSLAMTDVWTDRETGEQKKKTEWIRVVAFKKTAEVIGKYLNKGSRVWIETEVQTRKWEDRDGSTRYTTEFVLQTTRNLNFLDTKGAGGGGNYSQGNDSPPSSGNIPGPEDDDIPF